MDKIREWIREHPKFAAVLGVAGVALLIVLIYYFYQKRKQAKGETVSQTPAGMIYAPGPGGGGGGQVGDTGGTAVSDIAGLISQQTKTVSDSLSAALQQLTQAQAQQTQAIQQMLEAQQQSLQKMISALQPPPPKAPEIQDLPYGGTIMGFNYKYGVTVPTYESPRAYEQHQPSGTGMIFSNTLEELMSISNPDYKFKSAQRQGSDLVLTTPEVGIYNPAYGSQPVKFGGNTITIKNFYNLSPEEQRKALLAVS